MAHPYQSLAAPLSLSIAANQTVVAGATNARIRVMSVVLSNSGAAAALVTFQSNTTALTAAIVVPVAGSVVMPYHDDGWMVTSSGAALEATVTGAAVTGVISYVTL